MDIFKWHIQPKSEDKTEKIYADAYKKEKEFIKIEKEKIRRHWERSREYRIMLQNYQKELREREKKIEEREEKFNRECFDREEHLRRKLNELEDYESAIRKAELICIDWCKRVDRKEIRAFNEIEDEVKKIKENTLDLDCYGFEEHIANILKQNGYQDVSTTQKSRDFGADVIASKDGIKYVIQCKYYSSMVGIEAVQQIYSAKAYYDAHIAIVATNNVFTHAAKALAKELNVILWDCGTIRKMELSSNM